MGVVVVVHLYVFPAVPYKIGERCVHNAVVMADYASLGTPPDPAEVRDCDRSTRTRISYVCYNKKRGHSSLPLVAEAMGLVGVYNGLRNNTTIT